MDVIRSMSGELKEDSVLISDQKEGCQLYNKGNFGYPVKGGGLDLDLIEATYLLEGKRLEVTENKNEVTFEQMFKHASAQMEGFDIKYMVYRDMRERGFVVKSETGSFDMSVFPRGMKLSNSRPIYLIRAVSERTTVDISTFSSEVSETEKKGKELLYGVVDEEGDITYYNMSTRTPEGFIESSKPEKAVVGTLIRDRVFIFSPEEGESLYEAGFFGKKVKNVLQLSIIESCYLVKNNYLTVNSIETGKEMTLAKLIKFGEKSQDEFALRLAAYEDLKSKNLVVKTGFKYGTHFRVYEKSPDDCHARYLVHAVTMANKSMWPEISRTVRLSSGVKKEILFCRIGEDVTEYLEFKWFRP